MKLDFCRISLSISRIVCSSVESEIARQAIEDYILGRKRQKKVILELERYRDEAGYLMSKMERQLMEEMTRPISVTLTREIQIISEIQFIQNSQSIILNLQIINGSKEKVVLDRLLLKILVTVAGYPFGHKQEIAYLKNLKLMLAPKK